MDKTWHPIALASFLLALAFALTSAAGATPAAAAPSTLSQRLIVESKSAADQAALRADIAQSGGKILIDRPEIQFMVVVNPNSGAKAALKKNRHVANVAQDRIEQLIRPELQQEFFGTTPSANPTQTRITVDASGLGASSQAPTATVTPDPAFRLAGLMWNVNRIDAPAAWNRPLGIGYQSIKVGVADTGLDYTHVELAKKVDSVVDFTLTEQPNICKDILGGKTDQELATQMHAPSSNLDFNGHGSWIGGNIAASLNMTGTNGIAPGVQLVSLKISQNCGSAYDSEIIDAFDYAANNGIDIVSISFGGYLDRKDPEQNLIYRLYQRVVKYALSKGTLIIAAAGNEHTRIGTGGLVISHGILDVPPGGTDFFGLWENPGGITGVVDVSATGNIVNGPSATCPADSLAAGSHQWCKPTTDAHQPFGVGKENQLTYYSNYGPRIDFAAPGGARKFNVPAADRGGTEGWPWTGTGSVLGGSSVSDGFNAWQDFSITSNFATEIPCFTFTGSTVFPANQCYAIIQGTSMATPHVSAVAALALSTHPELVKNPIGLLNLLRRGAKKLKGNTTPPVSATDTSAMDQTGVACTKGFCHLGGKAITDNDAYGFGLIDALGAVLKGAR